MRFAFFVGFVCCCASVSLPPGVRVLPTKLGCFRHGRPGGEGSGLAAGFVGKVLVWLGGKGYGQGYRVMVMLMVRLGRYGYGLASWVGFSGMVMVRLRG